MSNQCAGPMALGQLADIACAQARLLQSFQIRHRRFLRIVETHQKWLLLHLLAVLAVQNRAETGLAGATANQVAEQSADFGIASRNTVLSFLGQLEAYGYVERASGAADRRTRPLSLTTDAGTALEEWTSSLIAPLFGTADTERLEKWQVYLRMARAVLDMPAYRRPPHDVRLTQEFRGGWLLMSELLGSIGSPDFSTETIALPNFHPSAVARRHAMPRSTLYRLLRQATEAGIIGMSGPKRTTDIWLSSYHLGQFSRWNGRLVEALRQSIASCSTQESMRQSAI